MPNTPSNDEQLMLQLINRFRADPAGEAVRLTGVTAESSVLNAISYFGVSTSAFQGQLSALTAAAPLAWNENLAAAADGHNRVMIAADQQTHQAAGEASLDQRATNAGYSWSSLSENVFAYAQGVVDSHAGFVIDWGYDAEDYSGGTLLTDWKTRGDGMQDPAGHRVNLINASYTEIGIAIDGETNSATGVGPLVVTEDLGNRSGYRAQFVGVVIADADGDRFYDVGEGLGGVIVTAQSGSANYSTTSWSSGGYQLVAPAGTYTVTFSGGGLTNAIVQTATIGTRNVALDAIAGVANVITGTAGNDRLTWAGADILAGGSGNDTYLVGATDVVIRETANEGADVAIISTTAYMLAAGSSVETLSAVAGTAAINIAGNELSQVINGNDGANILSGNGGGDTLNGGLGDDVYRIFSTADVIGETGGFDTVYASGTSYFLYSTAAIEYLSTAQQSGTDAIYLVGNASAQVIAGNYGDNIINGRGTALANGVGDTLIGLFGNDVYQVLDQTDVVREIAGQGNDIVYAPVSYQLRAGTSIEALSASQQTASGASDAITLRGNELAQTVVGNDAANVLDGRGGNDTLVGRGGADVFAFTANIDSGGNVDTILDFQAGVDRIGLATDLFAGVTGGGILAGEFVVGVAAADADDRLVYNQASGQLYYDVDGNGSVASILFAQLAAGTVLSATSFVAIAPVSELPAG